MVKALTSHNFTPRSTRAYSSYTAQVIVLPVRALFLSIRRIVREHLEQRLGRGRPDGHAVSHEILQCLSAVCTP